VMAGLVGGQPLYDAAQHSFWQVPAVPEIYAALEEAYKRGKVSQTRLESLPRALITRRFGRITGCRC
jgi:hypothetical protein